MAKELKIPEELTVSVEMLGGVEVVAVYIKGVRHSSKALVVGPFVNTPDNVRYCNAIVDAARQELRGL